MREREGNHFLTPAQMGQRADDTVDEVVDGDSTIPSSYKPILKRMTRAWLGLN